MAWPDNLTEVSTNLPPEEFTMIKFAIEHQLVDWGKISEFAGYCKAEFTLLDKQYEYSECFELATSLNRKEN